jgi:hypothetical protein
MTNSASNWHALRIENQSQIEEWDIDRLRRYPARELFIKWRYYSPAVDEDTDDKYWQKYREHRWGYVYLGPGENSTTALHESQREPIQVHIEDAAKLIRVQVGFNHEPVNRFGYMFIVFTPPGIRYPSVESDFRDNMPDLTRTQENAGFDRITESKVTARPGEDQHVVLHKKVFSNGQEVGLYYDNATGAGRNFTIGFLDAARWPPNSIQTRAGREIE